MSVRDTARRFGPLFVVLAAVAWIGFTVPWRDLAEALRGRAIGLYLAVSTVLLIADTAADALALRWTFGRFGAPLPRREVLVMRAATSLFGAVQYYVGQAALLAWVHRRTGVPLARAASWMIGVSLLNLGALAVAAAVGLCFAEPRLPWFRPAAAAIAFAVLGYGLLLRLRPPLLLRRNISAPLLELGPRGHAVGLLVWAPYLAVIQLWWLVTLRWFGLPVPAAHALIAVPVVLVAASLPLSTNGLGLSQVAAVLFFARYAEGGRAKVLACTLVMTGVSVAVQALLGLAFLPLARRIGLPTRSAAAR